MVVPVLRPASAATLLAFMLTGLAGVAWGDPEPPTPTPTPTPTPPASPPPEAAGPQDAEPEPAPDAAKPAKPAEPEPDPALLAAAPPPDQSTGIAIARSRSSDHRFVNSLLAAPRYLALLLLTGPRFAAAELDDYLEARGPNALGRDTSVNPVFKPAWRFGGTAEWETALGPSLALRAGYKFAHHTAVDGYGGLFGARGQSGGLRVAIGRFTAAKLQPTLSFDIGREQARVFAGVGDEPGVAGDPYSAGELAGYDLRIVTAGAGVAARIGPVRLALHGGYERIAVGDDDDGARPLTELYDEAMLVGFDETQRAGTGELVAILDRREPAHRWIPRGAPSSGFYLRGALGYVRGEASRTGSFATGRGSLEARQLFDLFRGNRVLSLGVRVEAIGASASDVPFDRLPSLGGRERLRALARDEVRDRGTMFAEVMYEWALDGDQRAYVFGETGSAQPGVEDIEASRFHLGYGGGLRFVTGAVTAVRVQLAGSADGDFGFFLHLGAL